MKQLHFDFIDIRVGDSVQYKSGVAEVTKIEGDNIHLLAYGWVPKKEVSLEIDWSDVKNICWVSSTNNKV
jgi:hypothetical protein